MGFNVTGKEVATGVHDPIIMFYIVGGILAFGVLIAGVIYLYSLLNR